MDFEQQITHKRSLGALKKNAKKKPKAPDLTGTLKLQRHTFDRIAQAFQDNDLSEVTCNVAAWNNKDYQGQPYLTIEISARYVPTETPNSHNGLEWLSEVWNDEEGLHQ
jgi:hypothetical protein